MNAQLERELERIIDRLGLYEALQAIADIAYDKAEHLASVWQDHAAARQWRIAAGRIERTAAAVRGTV
jgi:hypothetical protein